MAPGPLLPLSSLTWPLDPNRQTLFLALSSSPEAPRDFPQPFVRSSCRPPDGLYEESTSVIERIGHLALFHATLAIGLSPCRHSRNRLN